MHYLTLVTAPATYPVTLAELKSHLAIDVATEDTRLTSLIAAATDLCEIFTGRSFVTQTWKLTMPSFPYANNELFLPLGSNVINSQGTIYNRWGENIYTWDNSAGWDGSSEGQFVAAGIYAYVTDITFVWGDTVRKKGWVMVVR